MPFEAPLKILSLFSGIGGFERGAELVNLSSGTQFFQTVAMCEQNSFCQKVLLKNFPGVPIIEDVRNVTVESLQQLGITKIDVVCGGPPCQPFSQAGKRKGSADKRDMFPEFFRVIRIVRPKWILVENVPQLRTIDAGRYFRDILWQFSQMRLDAEWGAISAASVGAVHRRDRLWIIAYPQGSGWSTSGSTESLKGTNFAPVSSSDANGWYQQKIEPQFCRENARISGGVDGDYLIRHKDLEACLRFATDADDIPYRRERIESIGNSICPQVAAVVWQRLLAIKNCLDSEKGSRS